jgi:hypothetical protein
LAGGAEGAASTMVPLSTTEPVVLAVPFSVSVAPGLTFSVPVPLTAPLTVSA